MSDTAKELQSLAAALEQSKDLADKNKEAQRLLDEHQAQIKNAENDLNYLRSEVQKVTDALVELNRKHAETLRAIGEETSKVQIDLKLAKEELDSVNGAIAKEKADLEAKNADLDIKLGKLAEAKKTNQSILNDKKAVLEQIKEEEAKLEDTRAKAEGQVNAMNSLSAKIQSTDQQQKQQEESLVIRDRSVTNKLEEVKSREALVESKEVALLAREKKLAEDQSLVDVKIKIIEDKETYIVKLIEESKLKGVDTSKFEAKPEPKPEPVKEEATPLAGPVKKVLRGRKK